LLSEADDLLPIRLVESYAYCPRQAWYRFVANEDPLNLDMERGLRRHERVDATAGRLREAGWVARHLAVCAPDLGVAGVLDEVRIADDALTITEYKASRVVPTPWAGILRQLAVQHLALREHVARGPWRGPALPPSERTSLRVFYADSGRARAVGWSPGHDDQARAAIAAGLELFRLDLPPPGRIGLRCRACQHEPICLPGDLPILRAACR